MPVLYFMFVLTFYCLQWWIVVLMLPWGNPLNRDQKYVFLYMLNTTPTDSWEFVVSLVESNGLLRQCGRLILFICCCLCNSVRTGIITVWKNCFLLNETREKSPRKKNTLLQIFGEVWIHSLHCFLNHQKSPKLFTA